MQMNSYLYEKIGFNKEVISRGRFAELTTANQLPFRPDEANLFQKSTQNAYKQFRDKAVFSRSMNVDEMEEVAQGRVWTGNDVVIRGLVDAIGGISRDIAIAKQKANIPQERQVVKVGDFGVARVRAQTGVITWNILLDGSRGD